jgi:mannose-1-phosphate guanylyltransferase/mannose-6-phosphate isomerase
MLSVSPFILCGGSGTRLWPLSREAYPKQFHRILGAETLFQQACLRFANPFFNEVVVIGHYRHRFLVADQLSGLGISAKIILEPRSRSTAPAACIAALMTAAQDPNALVLVAPSDHVMGGADAVKAAIENGARAALSGSLVLFGVVPDRPHTGYGYIDTGRAEGPILTVKRFVEKPSRAVAEALVAAGSGYWNAGIFLCRADKLVELMAAHVPTVLSACRSAVSEAREDLAFTILGETYADAPTISLDRGVAEKTAEVACVPLGSSWSDVGSWSAIWNVLEKDECGNAAHGDAEIMLESTRNSLAYSDEPCLVLLGVENLVVVAMGDAVLVTSKSYAENVKGIVEQLKNNGSSHVLEHNRVYRPWGWYQTLSRGDRYQVKCIMVKPGGKLSLQSHQHRAEHWVVVEGALEVTKGDKTELLTENQSTYIAIGKLHRLTNPGKVPAILIEVQSGPYLDENDIIRYEDIYGRGGDGRDRSGGHAVSAPQTQKPDE